jgi:peptidoglycan/LPS O-acetylase OafA/YrhL
MTNTRINEIDLLRFFAALSVVFFHYAFRGYAADAMSVMPYPLLASFSKYGYLGVELFFMISGFVILMTAASGNLRSFVISRIVRLYPAFWACCTITFLVTIAIGGPRFSASISQYLINMTMFSGFLDVPSIDGAYWSLFIEIQFYALVALVLILGRIRQAHIFLVLWLVASIALEIFPVEKLSEIFITDFSAFFIAGAMFYLVWFRGPSATRLAIIATSWCLAIFQAINELPEFEKQYHTNMSSYVVAGIITIFYLLMLLVSIRRTGVIGRKRWLLAGVLTYPLYLLHQHIGFMIFNVAYPTINPHILFWGTIMLVIGTAFSVHVLVEKRFSSPLKLVLNRFADRLEHLVRRSSGHAPS